MSTRIQSVIVLGLGKVGFLVAELLHLTGFKVTGADLASSWAAIEILIGLLIGNRVDGTLYPKLLVDR